MPRSKSQNTSTPEPEKKVGPKPKLKNPAIRQALITALGIGATKGLACQHAGIAEATFYDAMDRGRNGDPEWVDLVEEVERAEAKAAIGCLAVVQRAAATNGQWQAAAWLLERKFGYRRDEPAVRVELPVTPADASGVVSLLDKALSAIEAKRAKGAPDGEPRDADPVADGRRVRRAPADDSEG
jgi:hypothetical protein